MNGYKLPIDRSARVIYFFVKQNGRCYYCKRPLYKDGMILPYGFDHKHPKSRGGKDDLINLALSCNDCNMTKGDMTEAEYALVQQKIGEGVITPKDVQEYQTFLKLKAKFEPEGAKRVEEVIQSSPAPVPPPKYVVDPVIEIVEEAGTSAQLPTF